MVRLFVVLRSERAPREIENGQEYQAENQMVAFGSLNMFLTHGNRNFFFRKVRVQGNRIVISLSTEYYIEFPAEYNIIILTVYSQLSKKLLVIILVVYLRFIKFLCPSLVP